MPTSRYKKASVLPKASPTVLAATEPSGMLSPTRLSYRSGLSTAPISELTAHIRLGGMIVVVLHAPLGRWIPG